MSETTEIQSSFEELQHKIFALVYSHGELLSALRETLHQLENSPIAFAEPIDKARLAIQNAEALKK